MFLFKNVLQHQNAKQAVYKSHSCNLVTSAGDLNLKPWITKPILINRRNEWKLIYYSVPSGHCRMYNAV